MMNRPGGAIATLGTASSGVMYLHGYIQHIPVFVNAWLAGRCFPQVALRLFHNKSAAQANLVGGCYNPATKAKGLKDFVTQHSIKEVTPRMIAYAALQVCPMYTIFQYSHVPYRHMWVYRP